MTEYDPRNKVSHVYCCFSMKSTIDKGAFGILSAIKNKDLSKTYTALIVEDKWEVDTLKYCPFCGKKVRITVEKGDYNEPL